MSDGPFAVVREYGDLIAALKARRKALRWSQIELDERSGLQLGYTSKLEAWNGRAGKTLGPVSLPLLLSALGVALAVVPQGVRRRAVRPVPEQLSLDLVGGEMARRSGREWVRRPGRPRPPIGVEIDHGFASDPEPTSNADGAEDAGPPPPLLLAPLGCH